MSTRRFEAVFENFREYRAEPKGCKSYQRNILGFPKPLRDVNRLSRDNSDIFEQRNHDMRKPLVFLAHARPMEGWKTGFMLSVFSAGIDMPAFNRSFITVGCRVGNNVYPVVYVRRVKTVKGPAHCMIPRNISNGEHIGVVIERDESVEEALRGTVQKNVTFESISSELYSLHSPLRLSGSLATKESKNFLGVRSTVQWHNQLETYSAGQAAEGPRYNLCMVTMIKAYTNLIDDWVEYHRKLGVDMFYIYDNDAEENLEVRYKERSDIEVIYWPWRQSQVQCFNHFSVASVHRCKYAAYFDVDEYIFIGIHSLSNNQVREGILKEYLRRLSNRGFTQFLFKNIYMSNPGFLQAPKKPLPEAYTYWDNTTIERPPKCILKTNSNFMTHMIHVAKGQNDQKHFNKTMDLRPKSLNDAAAVVHFRNRSWEEWVLKHDMGFASDMGRYDRQYLLDNPDMEYMNTSSLVKYEFFRDVWKRVLRFGSNKTQDLDEVSKIKCIT